MARTLVILCIIHVGKGEGEGLKQGRGAEEGWGEGVPSGWLHEASGGEQPCASPSPLFYTLLNIDAVIICFLTSLLLPVNCSCSKPQSLPFVPPVLLSSPPQRERDKRAVSEHHVGLSISVGMLVQGMPFLSHYCSVLFLFCPRKNTQHVGVPCTRLVACSSCSRGSLTCSGLGELSLAWCFLGQG